MNEDSFKYEPWVEKCLTCKHAYRRKTDAEELRCRCRKGCNYERCKKRGKEQTMNDDLIKRSDAIKALCKLGHEVVVIDKLCSLGVATEFIDAIRAIPSADRPQGEWIPCSERLPEVGKDVMVCYDFKGHRSVLIGVLYGDEKFHGYDDEYLTPEGRKYRKAVAWMPLPEPYEAESEDKE